MTLPTGTLTFLFTDIEGSTRLMQELGDRYVKAQVDHHAILRAAFKAGDGRELRTEGDSFFCVFTSAVDACTAAAAAQRGFFTHDWADGKPIRNRFESTKDVPARTPQSDELSKDLKRRGFNFVGSTICYAMMQAVGMVDDHLTTCFRRRAGR